MAQMLLRFYVKYVKSIHFKSMFFFNSLVNGIFVINKHLIYGIQRRNKATLFVQKI